MMRSYSAAGAGALRLLCALEGAEGASAAAKRMAMTRAALTNVGREALGMDGFSGEVAETAWAIIISA
jgi:hypothetical protein